MTKLARPPRRSRDAIRAGLRAVCCALAIAGVFVGTLPAQAQNGAARPNVTVDLGALDTIAPPPPGTPPSRIRLHMPESAKPAAAAKKPPTRVAAPATPPPTTTPAPTTVPAATTPAPSATALAEPPPTSPGKAMVPPPPPNLPPPAVGANAKPTPDASAPKPNATANAVGGVTNQILFPADGIKLPDDAKAELDQLAKRLSADGHLYVQLVGYAGGEADASQARRISLSRALAARSYLVDQGVQIKQVDVRPLGNKTDPGMPPDRVDLVLAQR
jgi:outer membrane protein OmpA-like peptidoglycan-associated protein